jgi:two-component system, NarL family, invasion response regulator UvrY
MIKVFLVDDHELVRAGIRRILEDVGDMEIVGEAADGESALSLVRAASPDVILMDLSMPGMGGIEATRRILRSVPGAKVIALTMLDEAPFPARLKEAGALGYLTKGCPAKEMIEAVRTVRRGFPFVASTVACKHMLADWGGIASSPFAELSSRELQVTMMILEGQRAPEISDALSLSPKTVSTYRQRIYEKLRVKTDAEMTRLAFRHGLIKEDAGPG